MWGSPCPAREGSRLRWRLFLLQARFGGDGVLEPVEQPEDLGQKSPLLPERTPRGGPDDVDPIATAAAAFSSWAASGAAWRPSCAPSTRSASACASS